MKTISKTLSDGSVLTLEKTDQITFPKGVKILVTDPCYWFDKKEGGILDGGIDIWQEFCGLMFPENWNTIPQDENFHSYGKAIYTTKDGKKVEFLYTSTAHGDGSYQVVGGGCVEKISGDGFIGVDAGMFAVVLVDDAKLFSPNEFTYNGYHFGCGVVFETTAESTVVVDGANMEGAVYCNTDAEEEAYCSECGNECASDEDLCYDCYIKDEEEEQEEDEEE